jgi:hypothetical protein
MPRFKHDDGKLSDEVWVYDHERDRWEQKYADLCTFLVERFVRKPEPWEGCPRRARLGRMA